MHGWGHIPGHTAGAIVGAGFYLGKVATVMDAGSINGVKTPPEGRHRQSSSNCDDDERKVPTGKAVGGR